jgi:solute carrier family 39 (zinc transporter), member 1/2/3
MTGGWAVYSWPPAIVLVTVMMVFLLDFLAEQYVAKKYGILQQIDIETLVTNGQVDSDLANGAARQQQPHSKDAISQEQERKDLPAKDPAKNPDLEALSGTQTLDMEERSFQQQIAAFLILEFGVIFHSVIIGLNLGTAGSEFSTLYAVLVFHQSFEGLGIGARMSAIPFPKRVSWLPWALCTAYGLTTPIAIAIGLGLRTTYNGGSYTANVVSGVLDAISAGILIYTGLVELLARDFLFNPELTRSSKRQAFMIFNVFLGAALMALLGKWA